MTVEFVNGTAPIDTLFVPYGSADANPLIEMIRKQYRSGLQEQRLIKIKCKI